MTVQAGDLTSGIRKPAQFGLYGFTLIELLITLVVVSILVAIAAPQFQSLIKSSQIDSTRDSLARAIKMTRGEAVDRKSSAIICATQNQISCSGTWDQGWMIFADDNNNGSPESNEIVEVHYGYGGTQIGTDTTGGSVSFASSGIKSPIGGGQDTIGVCDADGGSGVQGKTIVISPSGAVSVSDVNPGC